ncbi:glycoside hydrolase family 43 protein, partial [Cadophora sp. DSE1049]
SKNQVRYNPAIPGWHSDPSCVFVAEKDNTIFCTSSTFLLTPGLPGVTPVTNWKLASHALSRENQVPDFQQSVAQTDSIWAATIKYHQGTFCMINIYRNNILQPNNVMMTFNSTDPYNNSAWSDPVRHVTQTIDPDIFWDDDGAVYVATGGTFLQILDLQTGEFGEAKSIWNGTGRDFLEGPHLYKKDGYYYLIAAEGGSGLTHSVTISRSANIWGPYEGFAGNPVLTNKHTTQYFQNIGHADLFHDSQAQWWSAALCWRSGPAGLNYPMGRETVMTSVTWEEGGWPDFSPVRGIESGWYLPTSRDIPGNGAFVTDPDVVDFEANSSIPYHFVYWRRPNVEAFTVSPLDYPGTLRLTPS